jgi:glycosyltransferase involved in cell wall biosynthesis
MSSFTGGSRAIFITEIEQFGGAERSIIALSRWLHEHSLPHHVVTYFDRCDLARYSTHPLQVVELTPLPGVRHKIASLKKYFGGQSASSPKPLVSGYQPALHATLAGQRGFHTLMHDTPSLFGDEGTRSLSTKLRISVSNRVIRFGMQTGGAMIVTSEYLREECRRDFGVDAKIARMGGLSNNISSLSIRPVTGQLRMFSVCRIEPNKRIDWIVRALAALERGDRPLSATVDWRVDLAGKGNLIPALREMARTLGIGDRVHFHGFTSDEDLERLFAQAHLFLMPAIQGYGIPAIESLQRGIPVLLHRESGVSDILLETPWATVLNGSEEEMTSSLYSAIEGVLQGKHHSGPQPYIPTEEEWAERIATICNWK